MKNKIDLYLNSFSKNFKFFANLMIFIYGLFIVIIVSLIIGAFVLLTEFIGMFVSLFLFPEISSPGILFLIGIVTEILLIALFYFKNIIIPKFILVEKEMETIKISERNAGSFWFKYETISGNFEETKTDCSNFQDLLEEIKILMNIKKYDSLNITIYNKHTKIGTCKIDKYTNEKNFIKSIKYILDEKEEYKRLYE